jgi:EAL domain-containing protein (putative c-di-GMP-specific phosphodiesterase class I)
MAEQDEPGDPDDATGGLPATGPAVIVVAAADPDLSARVAALLGRGLDRPDQDHQGLRWVSVDDAGAALSDAVAGLDQPARDRVKAFVAPDGGDTAEVVAAAVVAPTLAEWGHRLTDAELGPGRAPRYGVRYQPVVDLATGSTIGFEALILARAGSREVDVEALFDRAFRGGWQAELDRLGRSLAIGSLGPWLGAGLLFLNVVAPDGLFDESALDETVDRAVAVGLEPDQVVFEAIERNRYHDLDGAAAQLRRIRQRGARLAVDDVGGGWASLEVVAHFRPDIVKLSGRLVSRLPGPESSAVVGAVVAMAHQLGTWVVAEGVESRQQAAALRALGVDWAQGHLFGHPVERENPVTR